MLFRILLFSLIFSGFAAEKNIIFFITDDESPTLGCYGDPIAVTPNIDALAGDGTRFFVLQRMKMMHQSEYPFERNKLTARVGNSKPEVPFDILVIAYLLKACLILKKIC